MTVLYIFEILLWERKDYIISLNDYEGRLSDKGALIRPILSTILGRLDEESLKMCSVNEDYDEAREFIPEEKCQILDKALCQKCNIERALVVLRGKDVYCNACFLAGATHKFRATLGKSKIVRPTDKILVAHSGKAGSTALLHLIRAGTHESVHKRLVFETKVLYIDEGAAKGQSLVERMSLIQGIREQVASLGFQTFVVSLSQSLNNEELKIHTLDTLPDILSDLSSLDDKLRNIFGKLPDHTSKLELRQKLRRRLIFAASRGLGCNKIFVADDSTSLAIDILANVSLGRGAQLSLDVGFLDNRFSDVTVLRPMRDFTRHELASYLRIHNLEIVVDFVDSSTVPGSIQELTEKFVTQLDSRFNGTVSTIFRTGEKVCSVAAKDRGNDENCALCEAALDTMASDTVISAIQATAFSRLVSSQGPNGKLDVRLDEIAMNSPSETSENSNGCQKCNGTCSKSKEIGVSLEDVRRFLCYGCRLIFRNSETSDLPVCVLEAVRQRLSLESMRQEITDFLL